MTILFVIKNHSSANPIINVQFISHNNDILIHLGSFVLAQNRITCGPSTKVFEKIATRSIWGQPKPRGRPLRHSSAAAARRRPRRQWTRKSDDAHRLQPTNHAPTDGRRRSNDGDQTEPAPSRQQSLPPPSNAQRPNECGSGVFF